ncbi:hypothetical protein TVAG_328950 [Trichomonas vaginalis G3]|uniref:EamA domain-containing protein n=1 Tax=Trichomonas vaginalis (strain ATCC PRA-98 / G3) TaxID=412133 RepID=A2EW37_TRIV3|nr:negative regulation of mitochondrial outer membrane permeabilization protein [Trichomonas vaginalis G3]EAY03123.1 hypothetical protein TVAG_328950 [Trichomonas vaginalis G3]KAI5508300.1 negative regulation of mitochondrial outer membrane permeabilization protein [Trichomonas vaginalis G3]|eukprot:XP_001315346.1 hypothetical protein [Trichomonas vaginalis G3]
MGCPFAAVVVAAVMLGTGTINTVTNKIMYQTHATTITGESMAYDKPWLCTVVMFIGEFMCMIFFGCFCLYFYLTKPKEDSEKHDSSSEEKEKTEEEPKVQFVTREEATHNPTGGLNWKYPPFVFLFSSCDLISTTLTGIGLVYCDASIISILRGFIIVFTLLFSWPFLGAKPTLNQVAGVLFAVLGLCLVGGSTIGDGMTEGEGATFPAKSLIGIGLTLLSQVFSSIQMVLEEKLLKGVIRPIPPLFLVGSEGLAGTILCCAIALPAVNAIHGSDFGSVENFKNAWHMTWHSKQITGLQILSLFSIAFFNWSSFVYAKLLSATARSLIDSSRTIIVWIIMVIVFYASKHRYGEGLTWWSFLEAAGFVFMILGTTAHNNIAGIGDKITKSCCCCFIDKDSGLDENEDSQGNVNNAEL